MFGACFVLEVEVWVVAGIAFGFEAGVQNNVRVQEVVGVCVRVRF